MRRSQVLTFILKLPTSNLSLSLRQPLAHTLPTTGGSPRLKNKSRQLLSRVNLSLQIGATVKQLKYVADSVHSQLTKKKENLQTKEHNNKTKTRHQNLIKMKNGNEDVRDFSDLNP